MSQYETLLNQLPMLLLVIFRIGGLMIFGPVFGSQIVPARMKVFFTLVIGVAVFPVLDAEVFAGRVPVEFNLWSMAPLMLTEMLIGNILGFLANLPMLAVQTGGLVMGQQMGLGFARIFNPAMNSSADIVGQVLFFLVMAGFLSMGGHEAMVLAVLHSFEHIPIGEFVSDVAFIELATGLLNASYELALRISAPLLALIFLQSVAMGIVARTMPQMNILSLGFPLRILAGLFMIVLALPTIMEVMLEEVEEMILFMFEWVRIAGGVDG